MSSKRRERSPDRGKQESAQGTQRRRPTISIIGAGRLGTALALALTDCGYSVEAMVALRKSHARRAARLISSKPLALSSAELDRLPQSDLLLITTPDDSINEAATRIASATGAVAAGRAALHTSGALSSDELKSLRDAGFSTGSMHPLVAVSEARAGAESLRSAFFCIEGERRAVGAAKGIVRDLGAQSFSISTKRKALYHAAAVMASGHMVALFDIATEMLERCGLKEREARAVLMPLLQSNINNLSSHEPAEALTGTFARADVSTVRRHLYAMRKAKMMEALMAYTLLGRRSLRLAKKRGAESDALEAILKALVEAAGADL